LLLFLAAVKPELILGEKVMTEPPVVVKSISCHPFIPFKIIVSLALKLLDGRLLGGLLNSNLSKYLSSVD